MGQLYKMYDRNSAPECTCIYLNLMYMGRLFEIFIILQPRSFQSFFIKHFSIGCISEFYRSPDFMIKNTVVELLVRLPSAEQNVMLFAHNIFDELEPIVKSKRSFL